MWHFLKMIFSKSYAETYRRKTEIKITGCGEINFNLVDGNLKTPKKFTVHFFENDLGQRIYKVVGSDYDVTTYWKRLSHYHEAELWRNSGIRPEWFEDILQKKLSQ